MKSVVLIRSRATDPAVNKIAKSLSENGYEVKLLIWNRQGHLKNKDIDGYRIYSFNLNSIYDRFSALFYFPIWWLYEFYFLLKNDCDIIHACDFDTLFPAVLTKIIKKKKFCYIIYDFYANNLPNGYFNTIRKLIRHLISSIEKFGISFADILFLVDESRYEEIKGAEISNIVYLYNSPANNYKYNNKQNVSTGEKILIFYGGIISDVRGLKYMIDAVKDLEDIKLILAGIGPDKELIEKLSKQSKKIQYIGWLPSYDDIIKKTFEADIVFRFSDPKHPKTKYESPNKLFEAMMCGKPIIVSDGSSMANIVKEKNCGLIVPYGDVNSIKKAIKKLQNNPVLRRTLGENGRKAYEKEFSWELMEKKLISSYSKLL